MDFGDELGEYTEIEKLVQDPAREQFERDRISTQSSSAQQVPSMTTNDDWRANTVQLIFDGLRPIAFTIFLMYWTVKGFLIRFITFLSFLVSSMIVDPGLMLWDIIIPSTTKPASKKKLVQYCTTILIVLGVVLVVEKYCLRSTPDRDLSKIYKRLDNIEEKLKNQALLFKTTDRLDAHMQRVLKTIDTHGHLHKDIEKRLEQQERQLQAQESRMNEEIKRLLSDQLPNTILVNTDNNQLELSPQFYEFMQSPAFMETFIKNNKESMNKYLDGQMDLFFAKYEKEGALISKDTFMKLVTNDLATKNENNLDLQSLIDAELNKYHQDVLNTADFALASRGGRILYSQTSPTYESKAWYGQVRRAMGFIQPQHSPDMIISPNSNVGECWRMKGTHGKVTILLSEPIYIQTISVEHPSPLLVLNDIYSAPKVLEVYGLKDSHQSFLGRVEYNAFHKNSNVQTFSLNVHPTEVFQAVVVKIVSNWGNNVFTDIYRIRIHGIPSA